VVSDSVNPALHELASNGDSSVTCPFIVELVVTVTLDGWVSAPGRGLNISDVSCGKRANGDSLVTCPFIVELVVTVTLDGWVSTSGMGLNISDVSCGGLFTLLGGVTVEWTN